VLQPPLSRFGDAGAVFHGTRVPLRVWFARCRHYHHHVQLIAFDDLANASELTRETWIARSLPGRVLQTLAARLEYWI
jgi:hypothetical protein